MAFDQCKMTNEDADFLELLSSRVLPPCECPLDDLALYVLDIYPGKIGERGDGEALHYFKVKCPLCGNVSLEIDTPPEDWRP